jgi:ribosomal protein L12E/L44/L45/RPP1/RPP2
MTKEDLQKEAEKMMAAESCCPEARQALKNWLDACGTEKEKEMAQDMIRELKEDVLSIDDLLAFAKGAAVQVMGEEKAKAMQQAAEEAKKKGETVCLCPACQAGKVILANQDLLLQ